MRYLIDGYNLLHALGLAKKHGTRGDWEQARRSLLDWLADQHREAPAEVTVVLDAQKGSGNRIEENHRGLRIVRHPGKSADELIEEFVAAEVSPSNLTVISNDGRVREAARHARCQSLRCEEYLDELNKVPAKSRSATSVNEEKQPRESPEEEAEWLRVFGGK